METLKSSSSSEKSHSEVVKLNIGGVRYYTTYGTLISAPTNGNYFTSLLRSSLQLILHSNWSTVESLQSQEMKKDSHSLIETGNTLNQFWGILEVECGFAQTIWILN